MSNIYAFISCWYVSQWRRVAKKAGKQMGNVNKNVVQRLKKVPLRLLSLQPNLVQLYLFLVLRHPILVHVCIRYLCLLLVCVVIAFNGCPKPIATSTSPPCHWINFNSKTHWSWKYSILSRRLVRYALGTFPLYFNIFNVSHVTCNRFWFVVFMIFF